MAKKKTFVLRIDPEMMQAVEKWAADDFRSINGQLEWLIYNALNQAKRFKSTDDK
ncbi:MAG: Arc family DNA binding domain-containing protein [Mariniphaga sp.]|nr:Arc family DNA binding domain-containing protein [Mariniphaga sp.]